MSARTELFFVDTNVLVYAFDNTAGDKRVRARQVLQRLWAERNGRLSTQVLLEFCSAASKKGVGVPPERPRQIVSRLAEWEIYRPEVADIVAAIDLQQRWRLSLWDAMILQCAIAAGCKTIYSEDFNVGHTVAGVRIVNPFMSIAT